MAKNKIRYIVNPRSGTGRQKSIAEMIKLYADQNHYDCEITQTEYAGHASILAREAVQLNFLAVVAIGGDGTINEIAKELVHSNTALGIIPMGSGNGLARYLRIPFRPQRAIENINAFYTKAIDTAMMNDIFFISIAGIGFDAEVAKEYANTKRRGFWPYLKISVQKYFNYEESDYIIEIDNRKIDTNALMVCLANSNQFGYNVNIAPDAEIDDGKLDVVMLKKIPIPSTIHAGPFFLFNKLHKTSFMDIERASSIKIVQNKKAFANIDGEAIEVGKEVSINCLPKSLKVICPENPSKSLFS